MGFFLFGSGLSVISPAYYTLIEYIVGLSFFIAVWVLIVLGYQIFSHSGISAIEGESYFVEFVWTFFPTFLIFILSVLNVSCFTPDWGISGFTSVKVIGRQWYWSYGLSEDFSGLYDSVMGDFVDSVDKPLRLCSGVPYCFFVTSADVIHSFSVPFLSIKVDAIPGRVNQFPVIPDFCGAHIGYCSELCGAGHAYMPIVVEVVSAPNGVLF